MLLEKYTFKIIPLINPDGVARGYFRLDTHHQVLSAAGPTRRSCASSPSVTASRACSSTAAAAQRRHRRRRRRRRSVRRGWSPTGAHIRTSLACWPMHAQAPTAAPRGASSPSMLSLGCRRSACCGLSRWWAQVGGRTRMPSGFVSSSPIS